MLNCIWPIICPYIRIMNCGELQHFQLYHNIVSLINAQFTQSWLSIIFFFESSFILKKISNHRSIRIAGFSQHGTQSISELTCIDQYYRSGVTGASFDVINSKCDILTVMWLYCAVYRTFLTRIWLFNNSLSNWKYVHEDFS